MSFKFVYKAKHVVTIVFHTINGYSPVHTFVAHEAVLVQQQKNVDSLSLSYCCYHTHHSFCIRHDQMWLDLLSWWRTIMLLYFRISLHCGIHWSIELWMFIHIVNSCFKFILHLSIYQHKNKINSIPLRYQCIYVPCWAYLELHDTYQSSTNMCIIPRKARDHE